VGPPVQPTEQHRCVHPRGRSSYSVFPPSVEIVAEIYWKTTLCEMDTFWKRGYDLDMIWIYFGHMYFGYSYALDMVWGWGV
jgi:hypothetical protein